MFGGFETGRWTKCNFVSEGGGGGDDLPRSTLDSPAKMTRGANHRKMKTKTIHAEEVDLAIPDMDSETAEMAVKVSLRNLPGIIRVLLVGRGAFASYDPTAITKDQICAAVRQAGYRASVFQDSKTGQTGRSSQ